MNADQRAEYLVTYAAVMMPDHYNNAPVTIHLNPRLINAPVVFRADKRAKEEDFFEKAMIRLVQHRHLHVIRDDFRILGFTLEDLKPYLKS